jgi:hypothetical protein
MTMSDDFFAGLRDELRAAYNAPPETPRESLWRGLQARRGGARPRLTIQPAAAAGRRRRLGWALPIAAALLLGVSIGRFVPFAAAPAADTATASGAPADPADARPATSLGDLPAASRGPAAVADASEAESGGPAPASARSAAEEAGTGPGPAPTERLVGAEASRDGPARPGADVTNVADRFAAGEAHALRASRDALYRVAALETLGSAEALLGAVGGLEEGHGSAPAALAEWSHEMLSQTRLLLDSPAAGDPAIRVLLQDLELVLAQLVRMGEGTTPEGDMVLIEGAVRERQLLHRIRAILPARPITSGT